mmetsp:Transcript_24048/g.61666  ORF Transcript_24048/g.61666 Transcript_24048/m.61666 type:complete len:210 (-) Transcript_24048:2099-2728(-)|eukprot:jgi/Tetstr1/460261/TSEL_005561.t1
MVPPLHRRAVCWQCAALALCFFGYLDVSTACSIKTTPHCNPGISPRVAGCRAPVVLRAEVLEVIQGERWKLDAPPETTVAVRVADVLKRGGAGWPAQPFDTTIVGFEPCCVCGTEAPGEGEEHIFFVQKVNGAEDGVLAFELAFDFIGSGYSGVSQKGAVQTGVADAAQGASCDDVYCAENPFCVDDRQGVDCPAVTGVDPADAPEREW